MLPLVGCNQNSLRAEILVDRYPIGLRAANVVELLIVVPFLFLVDGFPTCWLIRLHIGVYVFPNARLG